MNILDLIRPEEINFTPDSIAVIHNNTEITYIELNSLISKTALFLYKQGIKENDFISIISENNSEFIVTILSLWQIGAVPVPLNTKLLEKNINEQIIFLQSAFTIKSEKFRNLSLTGKNILIPFNDLPGNEEKINQSNFSIDKTALILFTSGSSGKSKAVMLSFNNLIQSSLIGNKVLNHTIEDKWLASLPFYHIGGFSIIFRALLFGTSIIIPDSVSLDDIIESIKKYHPTLASLVSYQLKKIVDINLVPPGDLRTVLLGGGFTDKDLVLKSIKLGWNIANVYGSTETSSFVTFMNTGEVKKYPVASGKAITPNKIIITDQGEITIKSSVVMKGYYNNDEETFAKLRDGFYFSGDIGYFDDEGYLYIQAKRNDQIISGGENINPVEVENAILSHPAIKEVSIIGLEDEQWGQAVSAAAVLKEETELSENELKSFLRDKIASYKIPKQIIFINQLPKSELGKILREEIKNIFNNP